MMGKCPVKAYRLSSLTLVRCGYKLAIFAVFGNNLPSRDPLIVAAVSALIQLRDEFTWGILPKSCLLEIFGSYGAQIVAAVSGKHHRVNEYRTELYKKAKSFKNDDFLDFVYLSLALGFANKWDWPLSDEASQSVK
jgi:hypothetical protein